MDKRNGPAERDLPRSNRGCALRHHHTPSQDIQSCGLRVLQYHQIIGEAIAQQPTILDGDQANFQEFLRSVVLPQLRTVNVESTERYYQAMRTAILSRARETTPKHLQTWPTGASAGVKRRTRVTTQAVKEINPSEDRPVKTSRQLQLWEPYPGKVEQPVRHGDPTQVMDAEITPPPRGKRIDNFNRDIDG